MNPFNITILFWEVLQTIVAGVGSVFAWKEREDAIGDHDAARESKFVREDDLRTAEKNRRVATILLAVQVGLALCGLYTCFIPPPPILPDTLIDVTAQISPEKIYAVIHGTRMSTYVKLFVMMAGSVLLSWLSYKNRTQMASVRRQRRRRNGENMNGHIGANVSDGAQVSGPNRDSGSDAQPGDRSDVEAGC